MKASELRISSLISYRGETDCVVVSLGRNGFATVKHGGNDVLFGSDDINEYKPVPLTEAWLVKFGFEIEKNGDYFYCKPTNQKGVTLEVAPEAGRVILYDNNRTTFVDVEYTDYVHQLQNLYFALVGKELPV